MCIFSGGVHVCILWGSTCAYSLGGVHGCAEGTRRGRAGVLGGYVCTVCELGTRCG